MASFGDKTPLEHASVERAPVADTPVVGVGLAALSHPADGLEGLEWLAGHGIESVQIPLALRFRLEPESLTGERLRRFRSLVARFRRPVIHAPYQSVADITFISPSAAIVEASLAELERALVIAAETGVADVVVHSGHKVYWMTDREAGARLRAALPRLSALAGRYGVTLAMETAEWLNGGPDRLRLVSESGLPRLRLCLDIGHLSESEDGSSPAPLGRYGSLTAFIADFAPHTSVVHIHDTAIPHGDGDGQNHHRPLGPDSRIDFPSVVAALVRARFCGPYIQELSPQNLTHQRILESVRYLKDLLECRMKNEK